MTRTEASAAGSRMGRSVGSMTRASSPASSCRGCLPRRRHRHGLVAAAIRCGHHLRAANPVRDRRRSGARLDGTHPAQGGSRVRGTSAGEACARGARWTSNAARRSLPRSLPAGGAVTAMWRRRQAMRTALGRSVRGFLAPTKTSRTSNRVLRGNGEVSEGWVAVDPELPATPDAVRARLEQEGLVFTNLRADPGARYTADQWEPEIPAI